MRLILRLNQLCTNPHFVGITPDAPFQEILRAQLAANLVHLLLRVLVAHHRCARDYSEMLRIRVAQLRDHFLGKSVAEILLRWITGEIFERKHGHHRALASRGSRPGRRARRSNAHYDADQQEQRESDEGSATR